MVPCPRNWPVYSDCSRLTSDSTILREPFQCGSGPYPNFKPSIFLVISFQVPCLLQSSTYLHCKYLIWKITSYQARTNNHLRATNRFHESNLLGTGGFGSVYKGTISDGIDVAVKVFNLQIEGAFKSFDSECDVLSNIRHRNLIKIISCCSQPDFRALVLQYMSNGSLENQNSPLNILQRLNIMTDVASALEYLHHDHGPNHVVHCDVKPGNILHDDDMVAHVADLGIARLLGEGDSMTQTMTLATIGYMAPEFGMEGIISTRGDVYSFGIVLTETFTRRKPTDEMFVDYFQMLQLLKLLMPIYLGQRKMGSYQQYSLWLLYQCSYCAGKGKWKLQQRLPYYLDFFGEEFHTLNF
ncbi:hypothetical protein L3X38_022139 [Prunus dulcis]|uniref:Protein kinase domain-containing protein n=1 Tax=Prunus dulcis TaxID=3755 RepID=A0AAD4VY59_PRUDU|nr:hypothetical protein L3X38_022139 [Prunus dulcis]